VGRINQTHKKEKTKQNRNPCDATVKNTGTLKMQDKTLQDRTMTDKVAGPDFAGQDNDRQEKHHA